MKKTFVVWAWQNSFARLRVDGNVRKGSFRIGMMKCRTIINTPLVIFATMKPFSMSVGQVAKTMAAKLDSAIAQYHEGLTCEREFIAVALDAVAVANEMLPYTDCPLKITGCGDCPSKLAAIDPDQATKNARHEQWIKDYDANK